MRCFGLSCWDPIDMRCNCCLLWQLSIKWPLSSHKIKKYAGSFDIKYVKMHIMNHLIVRLAAARKLHLGFLSVFFNWLNFVKTLWREADLIMADISAIGPRQTDKPSHVWIFDQQLVATYRLTAHRIHTGWLNFAQHFATSHSQPLSCVVNPEQPESYGQSFVTPVDI